MCVIYEDESITESLFNGDFSCETTEDYENKINQSL